MAALQVLGRRDEVRLERLAAREGTTPAHLARAAVRALLHAADAWDRSVDRVCRSSAPDGHAAGNPTGEVRYRAGKRLWSTDDDERMRREFPHRPTGDVAGELGRSATAVSARAAILGLSKSAEYLASPHACRLRRGDHVGAAFRFQAGHVPANKGLRRPGWHRGRMKETQFQPGNLNGHAKDRHRPVGSTRLVDGYVYRKVSDVRDVPWTVNWKPEHVLLWTAARGPIAPGHALAFTNGDRTDVRLDNLECITRRELLARNSVHHLPKPLADTIRLLGALTRQIRKRTHAA